MREKALTQKAVKHFPRLGKFKNFYLAGGTALSIQIGHRLSVDFDMFTSKPLPQVLLQYVKKVFPESKIMVTYRSPEQLNLVIDGIQYTFFQFEYPLLYSLTHYKSVPIASIKEIATMKAFSIGKRLSYKDYIDWYFLLKEKHVSLPRVILSAQKKFGHDFNDRLFLGQLVSLSDIPTQKIDFLQDKVDRKTIENFLKKTVQSIPL
jgi:hypothetical protein